jgi:small subunit ribosomal protein S8
MSVIDPISDMLARIRNASAVGHNTVAVPHSNMKAAIAQILKDEGFIQDFEIVLAGQSHSVLRIWLKYTGDRRHRRPVITGMERVSKPGRRVYSGKAEIPWVLSGTGVAILSTPKGVLSGGQARRLGVGGEVLCYVW